MSTFTFILALILHAMVCVELRLLPTLLWDPRNLVFACSEPTINVQIDFKLNVLCPSQGLNSNDIAAAVSTSLLFESAYLLSPSQEHEYNTCNATDGRLMLSCNEPDKQKFTTLSFKTVSGSADGVTFAKGKDYYLIGTGHHTLATINDQVGGSCLGDTNSAAKLKLRIHVCSDEEIVNGNCTTCSSFDCYYKDCAEYGQWISSGHQSHHWNGTHCLELQERNCTSSDFKCDGPLSQYSPLNGSSSCSFLETAAPSAREKCLQEEDSERLVIGVASGIVGGLLVGALLTWLLMHQSRKRRRTRDFEVSGDHGEVEIQVKNNSGFTDDDVFKKASIRSDTELVTTNGNGHVR